MRSLAVLSLHTSPLAQPGTGDGGGMNVYVRELSSALARSGVTCDVFTRAWLPGQPASVSVEPGFRVHHVPAGPVAPVAKELLPGVIGEFTDGVAQRLRRLAAAGIETDAIHANYWLSGVAGHVLKHELDLPLISTFHTLDRVKAEASPEQLDAAEPARRAQAEAEVIGCSDAVLASCSVEAEQLIELYQADPDRIEIVAPGVDHAFFAPGDYRQARRALGFPADAPLLLFVGRIQPLKALGVAVEALGHLVHGPAGGQKYGRSGGSGPLHRATLVAVGGPSGPQGEEEMARVRQLAEDLGIADHLRLVPPQGHEMLSTYYRAADLVMVPSRSESFGLVALEASACGIPVVASAVGGLTTLVDHGRTGFLVDGRDPKVFADYAARILRDRDLARSMGDAAVRRARGYTWAGAAEQLRRRYAELTSRSLVQCR
ncbi:MAG: D-inositol-3-phosphate glycosyltransferase [Acidimicrobiaceae bacterium]|nr:D-inositol-3-phosphate glycosyltransferase [Acidimicrobiaceae bacterium]MDQ1415138.1 D-inositol-3-phosphate glycosyltransferase [Acidimicrobiaceae bacterium]